MVVFTCNNCGESLQKPKVEKHLLTVCRRAPKSLTCVDCFKDFLNEEYVAHTKCVTEEERYAAKGVFPKGVVKKGEVKQKSWTEVIQFVVQNTPNVKPGQQQIFTLLSSSVNVPRKKNKFMNFVRNAVGRRVSEHDIGAVWDIIEKHKEEQTAEPVNENNVKLMKEKVETENSNQENVLVNGSTVESSKKRKSKHSEVTNEGEVKKIDVNAEASVNGISEEISKKKKKLKHAQENSENETKKIEENSEERINVEVGANETFMESSKKKKKKSKNVEKNQYDCKAVENVNEKVITADSSAVKTSDESLKKNKKKSKDVEESNENENIETRINVEETPDNTVNIVETHKKKKTKSKSLNKSNSVTENGNVNAAIEANEDSGESSKKKKKKTETLIGSPNDEIVDNQTSKQQSDNGTELVINNAEENSKARKRKLKNSGTHLGNENETSKQKKAKNENINNETILLKDAHEDQNSETSNNFCYKEKILEILKAKNSISLKKLQKKVLNVYQKLTGIEPSEKVIKKFNKQLTKVSGIEVSENNVRLTSN